MKLPTHRAGLPGNVDMITGSAFLPAYLPTAGRQGGASSQLARETWSGAPRAKARGPSTCFRERNPPKHTLYDAPSELRRVPSLHSSTL